jgi:hypothetical protein
MRADAKMYRGSILVAGEIAGRTVYEMGNRMLGKVRWFGFSVLWSGLLLSGLCLFALGRTPAVEAAAPNTATETATIAFASATYTVSEGDGDIPILLLIDPAISTPVSVTVFSTSIQAEGSKDFEGLHQSLVIPPNRSAYTLPLTILDDALVEGDEQLRLSLSSYQGASAGAITDTVVTIEDDDFAYLSIGDVTVSEESQSVALVITQSVTSTLESLVDVRTVEGSATAPQDYDTLFTTVIISPGMTAATVTVQLNGDAKVEPAESFLVQLEDPTNAKLANGMKTMTATITLVDDDFRPEINVQPAEADEADGQLDFVVSLSATSSQTVTVEYATANGSAVAPDDYEARSGLLTFPPGTVSATISIPLVKDAVEEVDETLSLRFTNPVQAILSRDQVTGTIHDGDGFDTFLFLPGVAR